MMFLVWNELIISGINEIDLCIQLPWSAEPVSFQGPFSSQAVG